MANVKHLKVLGRQARAEVLGDAKAIEALVVELVDAVGMRILAPPHVHDVELDITKMGKEPFEDEGGVSVLGASVFIGYGCLSTSHLAIHTWPLRGEYHLDIYSCREYSDEPIVQLLRQRLGGVLQASDLSESLVWHGATHDD